MESHKFKYYIIDGDTFNYYYIDSNGDVQTTPTSTEIENAPEGWEDISIGYERDLKKLGSLRSFTLPISFVKRVKKILRTIFLTLNTEAATLFKIEQLSVPVTSSTYQYLYSHLYTGQLDWETYKYEDHKDSISLNETGIAQKLKAAENTVFTIPIDTDPEVVSVLNDGMNIEFAAKMQILEDTYSTPSGANRRFFPTFYNSSQEQERIYLAVFDVYRQTFTSVNYSTSTDYFIQATDDVTFTFNIKVKGTFSKSNLTGGTASLAVRLKNQTGTVVTTIYTNTLSGTTYSANVDVDITPTISLSGGDVMFLEFEILPSSTTSAVFQVIETTSSIDYDARYKTSITKWLKPSTVAKRLVEKAGLTASDVDTTFLQDYDHILLGSGDSNRGIAGAALKTSLANFYEFVRVIMAGGHGIENNILTYGEQEYFLDPSSPIALGEVKNLKWYSAKDLKGNTVKVGYPSKDVDGVNGRYSFNNALLFSSPIKSGDPKEFQLVIPYISDPYYIEINRINLEGKTTTDDSSDNEVLILNTESFPPLEAELNFTTFLSFNRIDIGGGASVSELFYPGATFTVSGTASNNQTFTVNAALVNGSDLGVFVAEAITPELVYCTVTYTVKRLKRASYASVTGIPDGDTIYNVEDLTPKRVMERHRKWINSIFNGFSGQDLTFESTERNKDLVTDDGTTVWTESADFTLTSDLLFKPVYFEFETIVPLDLIATLETSPNRCFSFVWNSVTYKGFLVKAGISINDNKSQAYKLLCSPDTDLTTLI